MSPEQVIGKRAEHQSDIFSLGVILYEMLTGASPFSGENVTALMYQIVNFIPPAPGEINADVPRNLDRIAMRMLAKPLEERYLDTAELARDLRACERQATAIPAPSPTPAPRAAEPAPAPQLVDAYAKTVVLAQAVKRERMADRTEPTPPTRESTPAKRIAPFFDSMEATQRLATLTGLAAFVAGAPPVTANAATEIARPASQGWRGREWLLVTGAALCGLLLSLAA